jgi:hypothetical protein
MSVQPNDFKPVMDWLSAKLPANADSYPAVYARLYPNPQRSHNRYHYEGYIYYAEPKIGIRKFIAADFQGVLTEYGPPNIASAHVLFTITLLKPAGFTVFNLDDPLYGAVDSTTDVLPVSFSSPSFQKSLGFSAHPTNPAKQYSLSLDLVLRQKLHQGSPVLTPSKSPKPHVP